MQTRRCSRPKRPAKALRRVRRQDAGSRATTDGTRVRPAERDCREPAFAALPAHRLVGDGACSGFESLVRWQHPTLGLVGPSEFVPIAEECDLIVPLGDWVLREACRQLASWWRTEGRLRIPSVSVNLSREQLLVPDLVSRICSLARSGSRAQLCPSRDHGKLRHAGRGGSPQGALRPEVRGLQARPRRFWDRPFIAGLPARVPAGCAQDRPLVRDEPWPTRDFTSFFVAITSLAKSLGVQVVAEGVETAEQVEFLRSLECQFAQGYFFGRPMPAEFAFPRGLLRPDRGVRRSEPQSR